MLFDCEARQQEFMTEGLTIQANMAARTSSKSEMLKDDSFDSKDDFGDEQLHNSNLGAGAFSRSSRGSTSFRGKGRGRFGSNRPQCQLCGRFGHLVHKCWYRFDRNFAGVTADDNSRNFSHTPDVSNQSSWSNFSSPSPQAHSHMFSNGVSVGSTPCIHTFVSPGSVPLSATNTSHVPFSMMVQQAQFHPTAPTQCLANPFLSVWTNIGSAVTRDVVWYPDSGATNHITNDRANLKSDAAYTEQGHFAGGEAHS